MWITLSQVFGLMSLIFPAIGIMVLLSTLVGGLFFHIGWRRRHPNESWPRFAYVSLAAGCVVGIGLVLYNPLIIAVGVATFFAGRYMAGKELSKE
jgi:hypothetical protein